MRHAARSVAVLLCCVLSLQPSFFAAAQTSTGPVANAPLPAEVGNGRRVFVSNLGKDIAFPGDPDAAYNRFYADLKTWGHYDLVDSPTIADLVFAIRSAAPLIGVSGATNSPVSSIHGFQLQLTISQPATKTVLWTTTIPVTPGVRESGAEASLERSTEALTSKLKLLLGEPLAPPDSAVLNKVTKTHGRRTGLILLGAAVGVAVGGGLLLRHFYDDNTKTPAALTCAQNPAFCTH